MILPQQKTVGPLYAGATENISIPFTAGEGGANITLASVSTAAFTLKDVASGSVVNSRTAQNVKNANNFTIADGSIAWAIQAGDTNLIAATASAEVHRGELIVTLTDGQVGILQLDLLIRAQPW